jgi:hypothetical protein
LGCIGLIGALEETLKNNFLIYAKNPTNDHYERKNQRASDRLNGTYALDGLQLSGDSERIPDEAKKS